MSIHEDDVSIINQEQYFVAQELKIEKECIELFGVSLSEIVEHANTELTNNPENYRYSKLISDFRGGKYAFIDHGGEGLLQELLGSKLTEIDKRLIFNRIIMDTQKCTDPDWQLLFKKSRSKEYCISRLSSYLGKLFFSKIPAFVIPEDLIIRNISPEIIKSLEVQDEKNLPVEDNLFKRKIEAQAILAKFGLNYKTVIEECNDLLISVTKTPYADTFNYETLFGIFKQKFGINSSIPKSEALAVFNKIRGEIFIDQLKLNSKYVKLNELSDSDFEILAQYLGDIFETDEPLNTSSWGGDFDIPLLETFYQNR
jgi:hypothetical protein